MNSKELKDFERTMDIIIILLASLMFFFLWI